MATSIEGEKKSSIYTLEDYVSTFPKHQQNRYNAYRRALELYRQGGLSQKAIIGGLSYPQKTVNTWISERNFPPVERNVRELRNLGLYPLTPDNPHLPFLARAVAHNVGDGHLSKDFRKLMFFDGEKASLENLKTEYQAHFPKLSISDVEKDSLSNGYELTVYNTALAHLFAALGVPAGNKVETAFSVPQFVLNGSDEVKRNYIGALFGSEGETPRLAGPHSSNGITFGMSKKESLEDEHIQFLEQMRGLFNEFGIATSEVKKKIRSSPENPYYYFSINNGVKNLMRFFENIPFEFFANKKRSMEEVMKTFKHHSEQLELYNKVMALKAEGKKPAKISRELNIPLGRVSKWINGDYKPLLA